MFNCFMMHLYINGCWFLYNGERSWLTQINMHFWYSLEYKSKVDLAGILSACSWVPQQQCSATQKGMGKKKQFNALGLTLLGFYSGFQLLATMANL